MWDKLNKIQIQNIVALSVVYLSFGLLYLLALHPVPERNEKLLDILIGAVIGATITAVFGWLYTISKGRSNNTSEQK